MSAHTEHRAKPVARQHCCSVASRDRCVLLIGSPSGTVRYIWCIQLDGPRLDRDLSDRGLAVFLHDIGDL